MGDDVEALYFRLRRSDESYYGDRDLLISSRSHGGATVGTMWRYEKKWKAMNLITGQTRSHKSQKVLRSWLEGTVVSLFDAFHWGAT